MGVCRILADDGRVAFELKLDLFEACGLPSIDDLSKARLGALAQLFHSLLPRGESLSSFGILLTAICPIPAAAPRVLTEARGVGILRLSAAARVLTETRGVGILTLTTAALAWLAPH